MEWIREFLMWAIPGGFIGSIIGYFVKRPQSRNDFLKELQSSIDLLSQKNAELIKQVVGLNKEVVELRKENSKLIAGQGELKEENASLRDEIANLSAQLNGIKTITRTK